MVDFLFPSGTLVLVADGRRALFMKNVGTAMSVQMEVADVMRLRQIRPIVSKEPGLQIASFTRVVSVARALSRRQTIIQEPRVNF